MLPELLNLGRDDTKEMNNGESRQFFLNIVIIGWSLLKIDNANHNQIKFLQIHYNRFITFHQFISNEISSKVEAGPFIPGIIGLEIKEKDRF